MGAIEERTEELKERPINIPVMYTPNGIACLKSPTGECYQRVS